MLHLHCLEREQAFPFHDDIAVARIDRRDPAGHRREDLAIGGGTRSPAGCARQRCEERQPVVIHGKATNDGFTDNRLILPVIRQRRMVILAFDGNADAKIPVRVQPEAKRCAPRIRLFRRE